MRMGMPDSGGQMFLIHPRDLSIHEVDREQLTVAEGPCVLAPSRATASFKCLFIHGRFPECKVRHETLVFLKLRNGHGWVWASSISVTNDGKFPVEARTLGDEFFFIWPVPVAINVFFEIKEKRRMQMGISSTFDECAMDHPPCISYVLSKDGGTGRLMLPTVRRLAVDQLTVAQRLFVASLVPYATPFAFSNLPDGWCSRLKQSDREQLEAWRAANGMRARSDEQEAPEGEPGPWADAAAANRRATGCPLLELPDDLLERIVGTHIVESSWDTDLLQVRVRACAWTSAQFARITRQAANRLLDRVVDVAQSLLVDRSQEPIHVQMVVLAAGLSLRHALMMPRGDWGLYMRLRRRSHVNGHCMTDEKRRGLLM